MSTKYLFALGCIFLVSGCSGTRPLLGVNEGQLLQCPETPNCVNSQKMTSEVNQVAPILYSGSLADAHTDLLQILESESNVKVIKAEDDYIYAEYTSRFFQFVDDVEFYLVADKSDKVTIHVRSASRIGHSDFGVNRTRIERIRQKLM